MTNNIDSAMWLIVGVIIGWGISIISFEIGAMYKRVRKETADIGENQQ